ncbi:hypothetical protein C8R44DRAFT_986872 [Mycena epipterygia]|nr:hypothetical protein C8R44DRAFT_986872 [Mycena epipterygia]
MLSPFSGFKPAMSLHRNFAVSCSSHLYRSFKYQSLTSCILNFLPFFQNAGDYIISFASLTSLANAHFQRQFPPPCGVFVEDDEPNCCDGYDHSISNRTTFPLTEGSFSLNLEHTSWTGEDLFCLNLDLSKTNASVTDGQSVILEIIFNGGDGELYQCADFTLSSTAKITSDISCKEPELQWWRRRRRLVFLFLCVWLRHRLCAFRECYRACPVWVGHQRSFRGVFCAVQRICGAHFRLGSVSPLCHLISIES